MRVNILRNDVAIEVVVTENDKKYMHRKGVRSMNTLEGKLVANDMKIGIVAVRFNEFIV